ncbi:protein TRACHEARY ELEMENT DIFFERENTIATION-RELATED 7A-like [Spinacia oleracea]|uniref:Protein TRACHEARY ELEMENT DIFFERENTIATION-RELATED 7A-like n=1 Tax=Spinacia oleracea TaxID=3562 RepID=A0ABM3QY38_SPIOL|nr:protein TRACHEARY ELEMENT DIFFERENTIATION-RELATED 7A-like [Spinacia oleracea]
MPPPPNPTTAMPPPSNPTPPSSPAAFPSPPPPYPLLSPPPNPRFPPPHFPHLPHSPLPPPPNSTSPSSPASFPFPSLPPTLRSRQLATMGAPTDDLTKKIESLVSKVTNQEKYFDTSMEDNLKGKENLLDKFSANDIPKFKSTDNPKYHLKNFRATMTIKGVELELYPVSAAIAEVKATEARYQYN